MGKILEFPTEDQQLREITEKWFAKIDHWFESDEIRLCVRNEIIPIFDELLKGLIGKLPKPILFPTWIPKKEMIPLKKQIQYSYGLFHYQLLREIFARMVKLQIRICILEQEK